MVVTFVHPVRHTVIKDARDAIKCDAFLLSAEVAGQTVINVVIQYEHKRVAHRCKAYQLQQSTPSHWRVTSANTGRHILFFCTGLVNRVFLHIALARARVCVCVCVCVYIYIYIYMCNFFLSV